MRPAGPEPMIITSYVLDPPCDTPLKRSDVDNMKLFDNSGETCLENLEIDEGVSEW